MKKVFLTALFAVGLAGLVVLHAQSQGDPPQTGGDSGVSSGDGGAAGGDSGPAGTGGDSGTSGDSGNSGGGDAGTPGTDNAAITNCSGIPVPDGSDPKILSAHDVCVAVLNAASAVNTPMVIAVTDRQGNILAVYRKAGAPATAKGNYYLQAEVGPQNANEVAVALARTASFFSNDNAPLTSRTVRFISGIHFPPGINFVANADLYGIENTNRGCDFNTPFLPGQFIPRARSINGQNPGLGILTGKQDFFDGPGPGKGAVPVNPGGVPLFRVVGNQNYVLGGIGVVALNDDYLASEYAAAVASGVFVGGGIPTAPPFSIILPPPGVVIVGGIALPEVIQNTLPSGFSAGSPDGSFISIPDVSDPKLVTDPASVKMTDQPQPSPNFAPENELIPITAGAGGLTVDDVNTVVNNALFAANSIRGVIRLPLGVRSHMVIAVADTDGRLLALNRMPDATIFSIDVAVAKSRNVIYFTHNPGNDLPGIKPETAVTNRTISFGAQPLFPPGIPSDPGPFFDLFKRDTLNPCTQGFAPNDPAFVPGTSVLNGNISGIVFFPGAVPLYKNGKVVGGLGISGDGVDQDDYVTNGGATGFTAPLNIRADQTFIRGVRMQYQKFPRNPTD